MRFLAACALFQASQALPGDAIMGERIRAFKAGEVESCESELCSKPTKKYERILNTQPGYQWDDAGGYCGSWSIQRAAMAKGAWISQQQVRDHTVAGGGHDEEILETNIDQALKNLKLKAEAFDYKNSPTPQLDAGRKFMRKQLAAGHPLVQMIMLPLARYPVYPGLPFGDYSHIEPIVGIMSDNSLDSDDFADDDYIVHYDDASARPLYRKMSSLPGKYGLYSRCPGSVGLDDMCLHPEYVFSWAIQGFDDTKDGLPLSLNVDKWKSEPDTRSGDAPEQLTGTITVEGLKAGEKYTIYRWDSVQSAFDYDKPTSTHAFTADGEKLVFTDPKTFSSDGTTYYRCIADNSVVV